MSITRNSSVGPSSKIWSAILRMRSKVRIDPHRPERTRRLMTKINYPLLLLSLLLTQCLWAQEHPVDPTWLHRYLPELSQAKADLSTETCHYRAIFGEGDKDDRTLQTVTRFGEVTLDAHGNCKTVLYDRQEEIYMVLEGGGTLHYEDQLQPLRKHDFTYLPPGVKHSISSDSSQPLRVLVMGFKVPSSISIGAPLLHPKIANLDQANEETVS